MILISAHRLQNVEIYIGDDRLSYRQVAFKPGQADPIQTLPMNQTQIGRWVKVTRSKPVSYLTLCEVLVMGHRINGRYVYENYVLRNITVQISKSELFQIYTYTGYGTFSYSVLNSRMKTIVCMCINVTPGRFHYLM